MMAIVCDVCKGTDKVLQAIVGWMECPISSVHEYGQLDLCVTCRLACQRAETAERPPRELPAATSGAGDRDPAGDDVRDARGAG